MPLASASTGHSWAVPRAVVGIDVGRRGRAGNVEVGECPGFECPGVQMVVKG